MGLDKKIGLDIKGEGQPSIPHPDDKNWYGTTLPWMSFGYSVKLTSLQILTFYNAIANDGVKVKPRFIKKILNKGKTVESYDDPEILNTVCSEETADILQDLLIKTVKKGTAKNIFNKNIQMAGKTGTCRKYIPRTKDENGKIKEGYYSNKEYVASFAGFFPADNPKYSCIVEIHSPRKRKGYYGSTVAAPVFSKIAQKIYTKTSIQENITSNKIADLDNKVYHDKKLALSEEAIDKMPDLKGMSLMDALAVLENLGLTVEFSGEGKVKKQSILKGQKLKNIKRIKLFLG
jgi:cell division protein FtsI (penicillin-binding protein 3)